MRLFGITRLVFLKPQLTRYVVLHCLKKGVTSFESPAAATRKMTSHQAVEI